REQVRRGRRAADRAAGDRSRGRAAPAGTHGRGARDAEYGGRCGGARARRGRGARHREHARADARGAAGPLHGRRDLRRAEARVGRVRPRARLVKVPAAVVAEGFVDAPRAQGQWALAWRRLKRDRLAVACGIFLLLDLFAVGPGAPLYGKLVGHGPNDFFPYAVRVGLRPAGPLTG